MTVQELIAHIRIAAREKARWLDLPNNDIATLPPDIGQLTNLKSLHLYGNRLTELPTEIGNLIQLEQLQLIGNSLVTLPSEIGALRSLRELHLRANKLSRVPAEIGVLSSLRQLDLSQNLLTSLPSEIGNLTNLEDLDLHSNQLTTLPPELGLLANLKFLNIEKNPLISPPPEITEQGHKAIMSYLRERLQDSRRQWVSKLLVVGQGGVGKTSLLRTLRDEPFCTDESTTHGIEIGSLNLQHPSRAEVSMVLNTWDFGGQEIYHATHQFFLTNRSLFIVVWNARHGFEQGRLYYWLDTIKARAPESPVLLVATFTDERDADLPLSDLRRKYPQVVGHSEISNKLGTGIAETRRQIANAAANLPLMGENWPTTWLNAADAIRAKAENYVSPKELRAIIAHHKVAPGSERILTQWLHELGDILYFADDDELNDTVILNPQWVTRSISKVLESEEVIGTLGIFTREHMESLWGDIDSSMREHFLRLMEKFDLSYRTLENRDISLVVERLSLDPPDYSKLWDFKGAGLVCNEISMRFELDTTMPAGIPTWFIARSHRFTTRTHWRYGALFADTAEHKHVGLLRAFPHDRNLQLTVRGPIPYNFFTLLWDGLELTLRRFPGLRIRRKLPCPGHQGDYCDHEFELEHLENAIGRIPPVLEVQCPIGFESISVPGLLFGLRWSSANEVMEKQDQILSKLKRLSSGVNELAALTQREFTKQFNREQRSMESYCPNVFVLRPVGSDKWYDVIDKLEMQLYCQAPGSWHPVEAGGLYTVRTPSEWLQMVGPYIRKLVSVLKYATPLIGPWVGIMSADLYEDRFKHDIWLMEELAKLLPNIEYKKKLANISSETSGFLGDSYVQRIEGAALRGVRNLLEEKDPRQEWGHLRRILTPEGHYLWLCEHHAAAYI